MNIDFPLVLVLAVFVTGLVWLFDALLLAPARRRRLKALSDALDPATREQQEADIREHGLVEFSRSIFPVLLVVLVLRSFLVEPFQIPSGSMLPTLEVGDFILVNKYEYGIRLPVLGTKVVELEAPQRGDVIVFRYPSKPSVNYIKRVVGLPGDTVRYVDKIIYINGLPMEQDLEAALPPANPTTYLMQETLGERRHQIYRGVDNVEPEREWTIPTGEYFVMGDNRDHSNDSRYWGTVPDRYLVGRAFAIWVHWKSVWTLPSFKRNRLIQ